MLLARQPVTQTMRVHERCDTPAEYLVTQQWFVRVLDFKEDLLAAGEQINWHPAHMQARYRAWVENLGWDWCISRQRYFGVSFPLWYCDACGEILLADEDQLPIDPTEQQPPRACTCGSTTFTPEEDVMDTWATSSMSPQIAGRWLTDPALYGQVFPMSLRPQAHEIIRTWAFDTIVKSYHHFGELPWKNIAISGWGVAAAGAGKISKSRGGGPMPPMAMIEKYSADAVRYWAASTGPGKDVDHQRGENHAGQQAHHQALERGQLQPALPARLRATARRQAAGFHANGSLAALYLAAPHPARDGAFPAVRLRGGQKRDRELLLARPGRQLPGVCERAALRRGASHAGGRALHAIQRATRHAQALRALFTVHHGSPLSRAFRLDRWQRVDPRQPLACRGRDAYR